MANATVNITGLAITTGRGTLTTVVQPYYVTPSYVEYVLGHN